MTDSMMIEIFGPLDAVEAAVLALPGRRGLQRNFRGNAVLDFGAYSLVVGPDVEATEVHVDARPEVDAYARQVFADLAGRLAFPMQLITFDADEPVVLSRGEVPAAS